LLRGIPKFDDYVSDLLREPWIADERNVEILLLGEPVIITHPHQRSFLGDCRDYLYHWNGG